MITTQGKYNLCIVWYNEPSFTVSNHFYSVIHNFITFRRKDAFKTTAKAFYTHYTLHVGNNGKGFDMKSWKYAFKYLLLGNLITFKVHLCYVAFNPERVVQNNETIQIICETFNGCYKSWCLSKQYLTPNQLENQNNNIMKILSFKIKVYILAYAEWN